jgi:hypothetical protein
VCSRVVVVNTPTMSTAFAEKDRAEIGIEFSST